MTFDPDGAMKVAASVGLHSPCAKSKRGVVIVARNGNLLGSGFNAQPEPFKCDASDACRAACGKLCVHAEQAALMQAGSHAFGAHLVHVKVVGCDPVASGPPSCWQCSRSILEAGVSYVWLMHDDGLRRYTAEEFHRLTLENCGLPILT